MAVLTGLACGLYYNRRRLWLQYGLRSTSKSRPFYYRNPWRQMILTSLGASFIIASTPGLVRADVGTPDYDPIFYYYHSDHLGSAEIMTDRDGDPVQHYGYQAFGNERYKHNTSAFSVTNRYTGQQLDEDTGLYFYGSRYYDPALARFIQPDSVIPGSGSQALNRYSYCLNNPLIFTDPSGHSIVVAMVISALIYAAIYAGLAAATGGDVGKAAIQGAIHGAMQPFAPTGPWGYVYAAGTAALAAVVTGGDPLMAAAIAVAMHGVFDIVSKMKTNPISPESSLGEQHLQEMKYTNGSNCNGGGTSYEMKMQPKLKPYEVSSSGATVETELKYHMSENVNYMSNAKDLVKEGLDVVDPLKTVKDGFVKGGNITQQGIAENQDFWENIDNFSKWNIDRPFTPHGGNIESFVNGGKEAVKGGIKNAGEIALNTVGGKVVEALPIKSTGLSWFLRKSASFTSTAAKTMGHRIKESAICIKDIGGASVDLIKYQWNK